MTPTLTESFQHLAALSAAGRLPEGVGVTALSTGGTFYVEWGNQDFPVRILHAEREKLDIYPYAMGALMLLVQALEGQGWAFSRYGQLRSWAATRDGENIIHDSTADEPAALAACIVAAIEAQGEMK